MVAKPNRDLAQAYSSERVAHTMAVQHRSRLLNTFGERETFVKCGFDFQEAELTVVRAKLAQKAREGNKAAAQHVSEIREQQRALSHRRDRALTILRREPELIVPREVEFVAHALVVPSTDQADIERHEAHVEQVAMDIVRAFEEAAGTKVRFCNTPELARAAGLPDHPGFDVLSIRLSSERRCIEVKGRAGGIASPENERRLNEKRRFRDVPTDIRPIVSADPGALDELLAGADRRRCWFGPRCCDRIDAPTAYYLLHRRDFGLEKAPSGACILYARACGLSDGDLESTWDILVRTGGSNGSKDEDEENEDAYPDAEADPDEVSDSGSEVKLKTWAQSKQKSMGYEAPGG